MKKEVLETAAYYYEPHQPNLQNIFYFFYLIYSANIWSIYWKTIGNICLIAVSSTPILTCTNKYSSLPKNRAHPPKPSPMKANCAIIN